MLSHRRTTRYHNPATPYFVRLVRSNCVVSRVVVPISINRPYAQLTDKELQEKLKSDTPGSLERSQTLAEIDQRALHAAIQKLTKPHWTLTPSFWVALAAMVFAAIAAYPVIRDWLRPAPPARTNSSSPPLQLHLEQAPAPGTRKSQFVSSPTGNVAFPRPSPLRIHFISGRFFYTFTRFYP